jgi:Spy/CpxP family protein refolding chaperone
MEMNTRNSWHVRLAAIAIFILGFAAGALALNAYRLWFGSPRQDRAPEQRFEQMFDRLQMNDEQKAQARQILTDTREQLRTLRAESEPKIRDIRQNAEERFQKVLTPEQWAQFQKIKDERRGMRRDRDDRRGPGDEPTGP